MEITLKEVSYVARLARLRLNDREKEVFASQLESILGYISQLNTIDTAAVSPTSHALSIVNVMRDDIVRHTTCDQRERLLNNAPERDGDFFRVKKVIE
ncbi:MAG: Asp-tRNA(Asn)/Glu-tRNA(Gln) amidotransferase subunit GatC [Endomicrobiales bacterium]